MNRSVKRVTLAFVASTVAVSTFGFVRLNPVPQPNRVEPVYTITVDSETVNVADWIAANAPDYNGSGTIIKEGAGTLEITDDTLADFTGDIQIKAGRWLAKSRKAFGTTAGKTWVEDGAALQMEAVDGVGTCDKIYETVYLTGIGPDEKGAMVATGSYSSQVSYLWPLHITLLGNSKIYGNAGGRRFTGMDFNLNGYTCTWHNAGWDWTYVDGTVVSNGCLNTSGSTYLYQGAKFQGGPENIIRFKNGSGYRAYNNTSSANNADASWTQVYEDGSKMYASGGTSGWSGPVVLEGSTAFYCQNLWTWMVYWGPISGSGTLGGKSSGSGFGGYNACSMGIRLACPTNSFTGGINLHYNVLDATVNGAIPATGRKLTARGSTVKLTGPDVYDLPAAEFTGTGVVHGAQGAWRGSVVKKEAGTLIYRSRVGSDLLDIQGGSVRLEMSNTGLWEYVLQSKESAQAFYNGTEVPEIITTECPDMLYSNVYSSPKRWNDWTTVVYSGYLWNKTNSDVTWTFAQCYDDDSKLFVNGVMVRQQTGWQTATVTPVVLHPGPNHFVLRIFNTTGGGGATTWKPEGASITWQTKAFSYYKGETTSKNPSDYTAFTRESVAEYITPTTGTIEDQQRLVPKFTKVKLASGTSFDTAGVPYRLGEIEGVGAFSNGDVVVTNGFSIAAADVNASRKLTVTGRLTFTEGTKVDIAGSVDVSSRTVLPHRTKGVVIATATEGINGLPEASDRLKAAHWETSLSADGKSLVLTYVNGLILFLR